MVKIGDRKSFGGDLCTVRYIGPIPDWPNTTALGLEWDNASRGKNSGELHGIAYFTVKVPNSGSFVKTTRRADQEYSLDDALVERYITSHEIPALAISRSKVLQTVGAEKHEKRTANVSNLQTISLAGCCISQISLRHNLASLARLDLSDNLFTDLDPLLDILRPLNVEFLGLAGNRFKVSSKIAVESVQDLDLSRTMLSPDEITTLVENFPNLASLCIASNYLQRWPQIARLRKLDVSDNLLSRLPNLKLEELNILDNPLVEIPKLSIPTLYLSTLPGGWSDCAKLECKSLRLGPPYGDQQVFVIGNCESLEILNGTRISPQERIDAEIYTLRQTASGRHEMDPERYAMLVARHGAPPVSQFSSSILSRQVRIKIENETFNIVADAGVQRLVVMAARRLGRPLLGLALQHNSSLIRTGTVGEHFSGGETASLVYI